MVFGEETSGELMVSGDRPAATTTTTAARHPALEAMAVEARRPVLEAMVVHPAVEAAVEAAAEAAMVPPGPREPRERREPPAAVMAATTLAALLTAVDKCMLIVHWSASRCKQYCFLHRNVFQ